MSAAPDAVASAAAVLRELRVTSDRILASSCMQAGSGERSPQEFLSVTHRLKLSLEHGRRIADELEARLADTEHLLAGIVAVTDSMAVEILRRLGISVPDVRERSPGNSTWNPSGSVRPVAAADGYESSRAEITSLNRHDPAQGRPGGGRRWQRAGTYHRTAWPRRERYTSTPADTHTDDRVDCGASPALVAAANRSARSSALAVSARRFNRP